MNKNKSKLKQKNKSKLKLKNKNKSKQKKNTKIKSKNHRSFKSKMVGGALPMKVISYNVSWGAMSGDDGDTTAARLARHCDRARRSLNDETICLTNVRQFLENEYDESQRSQIPIGFIALQEVIYWGNIICRSDRLSSMGYVHHTVEFIPPNSRNRKTIYADLCTLYNKDLFKLLGVSCGNIIKSVTDDIPATDGRPYHKLFLRSIRQPTEKFIFINLHNNHGINIEQLQLALNDQTVIDVAETSEIHFEFIENNNFQQRTLADFIMRYEFSENSHIIMAGDTNDHDGENFWTGMNPFIEPAPLNTIIVNTKTVEPPPTCCVGENRLRRDASRDRYYSDYIMISENLNYDQNNYIPETLEINAHITPTSDHLPIAAIIRYP